MSENESRRPDFDVVVSRKRGDDEYTNTRVGAAWKQKSGSIAVRLEQGISVTTPKGIMLTLFPKRDDAGKGGERGHGERGGRRRGNGDRHNYDDQGG